MSISNTPEPTQNATHPVLSPDALRDIGNGILQGIDTTTKLHRDSPPESMLSFLLRLLLRSEIDAGRLQVHSRERIVLPITPALEAELDLALHQPATGAWGVVEVEGWAWHRRTRVEHDQEIRRERLLRRCYPNLEVYSASEVLQNPWGVALEIAQLLGGEWSGFSPVEVPEGLRALAEACASAQRGDTEPASDERDDDPAPEPIAMLGRLRALIASLPPAEPSADPALQALRRSVPRAYVSWHASEVDLLRDAFRAWIDIDDIAQALQRTPGAVWAQLRRMGLVAG